MKPSPTSNRPLRAVVDRGRLVSASSSRRLRPLSAVALTLIVAACAGCGSEPPPAAKAPVPAAPAAEAAAPPEKDAPAQNSDAVAQCLAAATAKRARFSGEPAKVGLKHVLVKYKGAKSADAGVTRSREEACMRAAEARDKVREGVDFDEVVRQYSEEPGAATRAGSIGTVERNDVVKPFADAAFELSVNQLSDVVETDFGFHIILRTE